MGQKEKGTLETRKVRILGPAYYEIQEIEDFIAAANGQLLNAIKVTQAIWNTIDRIGAAPFAFKECEQLPTKTKIYRQAACLSYLIIYKVTTTEVIILKVLHSARNAADIKKLRGNY